MPNHPIYHSYILMFNKYIQLNLVHEKLKLYRRHVIMRLFVVKLSKCTIVGKLFEIGTINHTSWWICLKKQKTLINLVFCLTRLNLVLMNLFSLILLKRDFWLSHCSNSIFTQLMMILRKKLTLIDWKSTEFYN